MDADALSRYPLAEKNISSKEIQAVFGKIQVSTHIINMAETTEPLDIVEITDFPGQPLAQIEQRESENYSGKIRYGGFGLKLLGIRSCHLRTKYQHPRTIA